MTFSLLQKCILSSREVVDEMCAVLSGCLMLTEQKEKNILAYQHKYIYHLIKNNDLFQQNLYRNRRKIFFFQIYARKEIIDDP